MFKPGSWIIFYLHEKWLLFLWICDKISNKLISLEFVTYWNVHILQWIGPFHVQEPFMNCSWTMCIEMFMNSSWTLCLEMFMNFSWIGPFHVQEPFMNCSCVVHEFCAWTVHARFLNSSWSFHQGCNRWQCRNLLVWG